MTRPRKQLVCVEDTPWYHVVSRCVRRTYLCGFDQSTGKNYEHRRQWIVDRIRLLSSLFTIEVCSYAVMSNHYHIVVRLCPGETEKWSQAEVVKRWMCLFKGTVQVQQWQSGAELSPAEQALVDERIAVYRERLGSLSWFMKCLNEPLARAANKEDKCTGHFWEARFKSDPLRVEEALLSCMVYVDLNPIRAAMANTPEESDYTSIQERIKPGFDLAKAIHSQIENHQLNRFDFPLKPLTKFAGGAGQQKPDGISFSEKDYLELVDYTGRIIRADKRGVIPMQLPPILQRMDIGRKSWLESATMFGQLYYRKFGFRRQVSQKVG